MIAMIKHPGQKLNKFGMRAVIGAVIDDQYLTLGLVGQQIEDADNPGSKKQQKSPPVIARISQQIVYCVFPKSLAVSDNEALEKRISFKGKNEDRFQQHCGRNSAQLVNTGPVEQSADAEIVKEQIDPAVQLYCFLLFLAANVIVHLSSSSLILLNKIANSIYQGPKGFSRLMQ
jgi:hypothetical protein